MVVDEAPSPELTAYLAGQRFTWSTYEDVAGATAAAFGNFGTRSLLRSGWRDRIRVLVRSDEAEFLTQVDALRNERR